MRQLLTARIHTAALLKKHLWAALPFLFTPYLLACDNTTPAPTVMDLAMPDLAMPVVVRDMAMADLTPPPDLTPPADMATPVVTGLPTDCVAATGADLYTNVVVKSCSIGNGCHGSMATNFAITALSDMKTKWVGVKAAQSDGMNYITAGDVDKSFIIYKLVNQQNKVGVFPGTSMPRGAALLGHDDLCRFISWIKAGAQ